MHKNFKPYAAMWAILLVLFNLIVFLSPAEAAGMSKFGGAFWAGYIGITLAFIGQLVCACIAFRAENLKKLFYTIPLLRISRAGLVLTMVLGTLCMAVPNLPNWLGALLCMAVLAFTAISVVKAKLAGDIADAVEEKVKTETFFIKSLTADAETLLAKAKSEAIRAECKKVFEAVRYSDTMSNDALVSVESEITIKFAKLSEAIMDDNFETVSEFTSEIIILLGDRNKKCKLLK